MIVDFPELSPSSWKFLNKEEADFVVARIEHDRHDIEVEPFRMGDYLRCGLDIKVWLFAALYMFTTTNTYAIAYCMLLPIYFLVEWKMFLIGIDLFKILVLPIILRNGMGFSIGEAQCLVAPPYVAAAIVMFIQAYFGDKWHIRGPLIVGNSVIGKSW